MIDVTEIGEPPNGSVVFVYIDDDEGDEPWTMEFVRDDDSGAIEYTSPDVYNGGDVDAARWVSEDWADRAASWHGLASLEGYIGVEIQSTPDAG